MRLLYIFIILLLISSTAFAANGEIKTTLYLNDKVYDQFFASEKVKIPTSEWLEWLKKSQKKDSHDRPIIRFGKNWNVRLNIKNNSDMTFKNPIVKITFGENWGNKTENIKTLQPPLKSGESIDLKINLNDYEFVGTENTSMYLMIVLKKDENISMNENYYCIWFDLESEDKK